MRIYLNTCKQENIQFLQLNYKIPDSASSTGKTAIGNFTLDCCGYADDLLIAFENEKSLSRGIEILDETFKRYRLSINISKTKTMILNQQYESREYPASIASLNGSKLENVKTYRYLGCEIKYNEHTTGEAELNLRSDAADCKFYSLARNMMNMKINLKV